MVQVRHLVCVLLFFVAGPGSQADINESRSEVSVRELLNILQSSSVPQLRRDALWKLLGEPGQAVEETMHLALLDDDAEVRAGAIYHFRKIRKPLPISALRRAAQDKSSNVREAVMWTLSGLYPAQHLNLIIAAIDDPASNVRTAATWAARKYSINEHPSLYQSLISAFDNCISEDCVAILEILLTQNARLPDPIRSGLWSKNDGVRSAAAKVIGRHAVIDELNTVLALVQDFNPSVRAAATSVIGNFAGDWNDENLVSILLKLLEDDKSHVRFAAAQALENFGFVGLAELFYLLAGKSEQMPSISARDQRIIAPILLELWPRSSNQERRRIAKILAHWQHEPAIDAGLFLVSSPSFRERVLGWDFLASFENRDYLKRGLIATAASPWTWLYILVLAATVFLVLKLLKELVMEDMLGLHGNRAKE